jgi:hypothetical protein
MSRVEWPDDCKRPFGLVNVRGLAQPRWPIYQLVVLLKSVDPSFVSKEANTYVM